MSILLLNLISALWLGILTSISPCPLASNIAAISFLSKRITDVRLVFLSGMAYIFGRMIAYALLGFVIIYSLLSISSLSMFLQRHMNQILGPILLVTGLILLDFIKLHKTGLSMNSQFMERIAGRGLIGSFLLGFIFALALCPVSAALFFGSLIPLALDSPAGTVLPFIYGFGTGLPVFFFALLIAMGVKAMNIWFHRFRKVEYFMRMLTGAIFAGVGISYIWRYIIQPLMINS